MVRLVVLAALAAVGFGAGRWLRAEPTDVVPVATAVRHAPKAGDACDQLASVEAQLARTRDMTEGIPRPFPDDPALQPAEFHRRLEAVQRACPEMSVDHVDCDDYPCFAWVRDPCQAANEQLWGWWSDIIGLTPGDGTELTWVTLWLASEAEGNASRPRYGSNERRRFQARTRRARVAVVAATGARAMTDVEFWTSQVRGQEQALEKSETPEMRAYVQTSLTRAQGELDRALRQERGE